MGLEYPLGSRTPARPNIPKGRDIILNIVRPSLLVISLLIKSTLVNGELKYDFHRLVQESEVVVETDGQTEPFDTTVVVQVASYKNRVAADFVTHNLTEDFADLSVVVKTVPRDGYFVVRISGFKDNRTVAFVIDQLVKAHFAPIKLRPK